MRDTFISELAKRAGKNKNIFLLTGDLGFSVFEDFEKRFPRRFINVGIAEANMIGVATGLSKLGKIAITYSIIPFSVSRCLEQIKIDVCYQDSNVKIVGVGAGYAYGTLGMTHHAIEDVALLRAYPNIRIFSPCDKVETKACLDMMLKTKGPFYLRLGKNREPRILKKSIKAKIPGSHIIREGKDATILSTGPVLFNVSEALKLLEKKGIKCRLVSMYSLKPIDKNIIIKSAQRSPKIMAIEEHTICGGLGSTVSEVLAQSGGLKTKFKMIGIEDSFCSVIGSQDYLREKYGFSVHKLAKTIENFVRGRK